MTPGDGYGVGPTRGSTDSEDQDSGNVAKLEAVPPPLPPLDSIESDAESIVSRMDRLVLAEL